jgi:hypothetical protein
VVFQPTDDARHVHVRVIDRSHAGVVVAVRIFEAENGRFIREQKP